MNPWRWVDPRVGRVRVDDLRAYFLSHGWDLRPNPNRGLLRFEKPARAGLPPVFQMVPALEQSDDYRQRVLELITTLSELEDRHPVAVLEDVLAAGEDRAANGFGRADSADAVKK
jgi:hypothetical protein